MEKFLQELVQEELAEFREVIEKILEVNQPLFLVCAKGYAMVADQMREEKYHDGQLDHDLHGNVILVLTALIKECQRKAPNLGVPLLLAFISSYGILALLDEGHLIGHPQGVMRVLLDARSACTVLHAAVALADRVGGTPQKQSNESHVVVPREKLAANGRKGAEVRHKSFGDLKDWAFEKAPSMRGAQRDIARKLVKMLPPHLASVSKDPERLIYDALREKLISRK